MVSLLTSFSSISNFVTHPYEELIEAVADKMKEHEDDNLGFGIFEKVDKDLGLSRGTAWDASGWKDYCDIGFGDV